MDPSIAFAGIIGLAVLLSVSVYVFGRLRIERERTLQKLIERGATGDELARLVRPAHASADLRRGLLLIAVGLAWSVVTFFVGGKAWMAGIVPVMLGATFVLFKVLDARSR